MPKVVIKCSSCGKKKPITKTHKYHFGNECEDCTREHLKKEAHEMRLDDLGFYG